MLIIKVANYSKGTKIKAPHENISRGKRVKSLSENAVAYGRMPRKTKPD